MSHRKSDAVVAEECNNKQVDGMSAISRVHIPSHTHTHDTHAALPCPVVLNVQQTVWNAADASARWHTQTCGAVAGDCRSGGVSDRELAGEVTRRDDHKRQQEMRNS